MHENRNLFLFLIEINNMHHTWHVLPIARTCIWRRCGWCGVSWHRVTRRSSHPIVTPLDQCVFCSYDPQHAVSGLQLMSNVVFRCVCLIVCVTLGPKAVISHGDKITTAGGGVHFLRCSW